MSAEQESQYIQYHYGMLTLTLGEAQRLLYDSDFSGEFSLILSTHAQAHSKVFWGVFCICGLIGEGTVVPAATMFGSIE